MKKDKEQQICCEYCHYKFYPRLEDIEEVSKDTTLYFCPKCGEEFYIGMEVKSSHTKYYSREDWK